jgi:2-hydroxycyclohexanecarboxyl-CoA dehydrogenase
MTSLAQKTCVVFGGSDGIGAAVARTFADAGAHVVIGSRGTGDRGRRLADELDGSTAGSASFLQVDITDEESLERFVSELRARSAAVDVAVVSGGAPPREVFGPFRFLDMSLESLTAWTSTQWWSRLLCLRACVPLLEQSSGRAKVVFVSTDAGRVATPFELAPGGAAAALILSTKVLARELSSLGICVNTVSVSVTVDTPGLENALAGEAGDVFRRALARQPFPVRAADVAAAVAFFSSSGSDAITGQTLSVNGGLSFPG